MIQKELRCPRCGETHVLGFFYDNKAPFFKDGKSIFCIKCCDELADEIMSKSSTLENGIRNLCNFFHYPFDLRVYTKIAQESNKKIKKNVNYLKQYVEMINKINPPAERYTDLENSLPEITNFVTGLKIDPTDVEALNELQEDWGSQDSLEDYLFLENEYGKYAKNEKDLANSTITVLRFLCLALLDVHKARLAGKDTSSDEKRVMEYYKKLKLDDFKFDEKKTDVEKLIEDWAYTEENIEPLDWVDEHLDDICHFRSDNDDIMRCIGNKVLGSKEYPDLSVEDLQK